MRIFWDDVLLVTLVYPKSIGIVARLCLFLLNIRKNIVG